MDFQKLMKAVIKQQKAQLTAVMTFPSCMLTASSRSWILSCKERNLSSEQTCQIRIELVCKEEDHFLYSFVTGNWGRARMTWNIPNAYMHAQSLSNAWLCDLMDCRLPRSSVHWIFQAITLKWVSISSSTGSSWPRDRTHISCTAGGFFTAKPPGASQMALMIKNPAANAGDAREMGLICVGQEDPLEE